MREAKHTPGKWTAGPGTVGGPVIMAEHEGKTWCVASFTTQKVWYGAALQFERVEPEAMANARLCAASKELLKELEHAVDFFGEPDSDDDAWINRATRAIDKAKGRT